MPLVDEAGEVVQAPGQVGVLEVVEGLDVEDLGDVEDEEQVGGADSQPVDVVAALGARRQRRGQAVSSPRSLKQEPYRLATTNAATRCTHSGGSAGIG